MRMRRKPNLIPRLERCAHVLENSPEELRGSWLDVYPGFGELHVELGCGKGRFTCGMAELNPKVLLAAVEKVPDALVVAMERCCERGLVNLRFLAQDAANLEEYFAPGEVSRIYINFPDPWPKKRQYKRRLTAPPSRSCAGIFSGLRARYGLKRTIPTSLSGAWSSIPSAAGRSSTSRATGAARS